MHMCNVDSFGMLKRQQILLKYKHICRIPWMRLKRPLPIYRTTYNPPLFFFKIYKYFGDLICKCYRRACTFIIVACFVWLLSFFLSASKNLIRISSVFYSRIRFSRRYRVIVTLITWKKICVFPRQTAHGV